jgi:hypothetical protein
MQVIRAKFKLTGILNQSWSPTAKEYRFDAQYDPTIPEDRRFSEATPSGTIRMQVNNPAAHEFFNLGEAYYLDFTKA